MVYKRAKADFQSDDDTEVDRSERPDVPAFRSSVNLFRLTRSPFGHFYFNRAILFTTRQSTVSGSIVKADGERTAK